MSIELVLVAAAAILAIGVGGLPRVARSLQRPRQRAHARDRRLHIQEGASAYLNRQYTIIAGVGLVVFVLLLITLATRPPCCTWLEPLLGRRRLRRHERLGPRQRPHRPGGPARAGRRPPPGLPGWRSDRHVRGWPRPSRRHAELHRLQGPPSPGRARLRRQPGVGVRPAGRRHLHQGGGRGRGPGRQGRGRHPRGRSPQPGGDRGQRGRQRRRLRRHGRRPLRRRRGHQGGGDAARPAPVPRQGRVRRLPAAAGRRLDHRLDHRQPVRAAGQERQHHERAVHEWVSGRQRSWR